MRASEPHGKTMNEQHGPQTRVQILLIFPEVGDYRTGASVARQGSCVRVGTDPEPAATPRALSAVQQPQAQYPTAAKSRP